LTIERIWQIIIDSNGWTDETPHRGKWAATSETAKVVGQQGQPKITPLYVRQAKHSEKVGLGLMPRIGTLGFSCEIFGFCFHIRRPLLNVSKLKNSALLVNSTILAMVQIDTKMKISG
jgi:hypothetical protein